MSILATTSAGQRTVWEILSDYNNITELQARQICSDFTMEGFSLPADGQAHEYEDMVIPICEAMSEDPSIREAMLNGTEEITMSAGDEGDPFYYNSKINEADINKYIIHHNNRYDCMICRDTDFESGGVSLSCSRRDTGACNAIFCKECVSRWLTACVSRCPHCREFCQEVKNLPVIANIRNPVVRIQQRSIPSIRKRDPKKCIVISIKK
jgi:hypothetical protein